MKHPWLNKYTAPHISSYITAEIQWSSGPPWIRGNVTEVNCLAYGLGSPPKRRRFGSRRGHQRLWSCKPMATCSGDADEWLSKPWAMGSLKGCGSIIFSTGRLLGFLLSFCLGVRIFFETFVGVDFPIKLVRVWFYCNIPPRINKPLLVEFEG